MPLADVARVPVVHLRSPSDDGARCDHGAVPAAPADAADVIRLWADAEPASVIEDVGVEVAYPAPPGLAASGTSKRNVSEPTLTVFPPRAGRATASG